MMQDTEFKKSGFIIVRNILDQEEAQRLYQYTLQRIPEGNMDDGQVPGSASFYQDPEVVMLQKRLLHKIEASIQMKLLPVFCYNRVYRTGAILRIHTDSNRAEISATINLGQTGALWDLWLVDYDENTHKVVLAPGDALIYHGIKLHHWRGKLIESDFVSQIMFHYVDGNGKNTRAPKMEMIRKAQRYIGQLFK